jgi:hypothetical protein
LSGVLAAYRGCCRHPSRLASESCLDQSKSLRSLQSCFRSQVCQSRKLAGKTYSTHMFLAR